MQAQTLPQTRPFFFSSRSISLGSMWLGSSTGISTESKPHFLNWGKSLTESLVKGEVKRKVLIPSLMVGRILLRRGGFAMGGLSYANTRMEDGDWRMEEDRAAEAALP